MGSFGRIMSTRYHAIDAIRGFCLVNIFITHLSTSMVKEASPSKLGFSDSAEIFVLLAGVSCVLAYAPNPPARTFGDTLARVWQRALNIYLVNLIIIAMTALFAFAVWDLAAVLPGKTVAVLTGARDDTLFYLLTMQQSLGFSMVLRLYVLLMLVAPFYLWLASRRYWYPLVPAAAIWLIAGLFGLVESEAMTGTHLALTFLPWNLVFAVGIAIGAGMKANVALPRSPLLVAGASLMLAGTLLFLLAAVPNSQAALDWSLARNDQFLTGASKTFQSPLRVLHILALCYVMLACRHWPVIRLFHAARADGVLCKLGRNSLPVFATSAVLAVVGDTAIANAGLLGGSTGFGKVAIEVLVVALGLAAMYGAAELADARKARLRAGAIQLSPS